MDPILSLVLRLVFAVLMLLASIFIIIVVMKQKGNTDGVSAISGSSDTDTFYGKNKSRRSEGRMKMWTIISACTLAVCAIGFFVVELISKAG